MWGFFCCFFFMCLRPRCQQMLTLCASVHFCCGPPGQPAHAHAHVRGGVACEQCHQLLRGGRPPGLLPACGEGTDRGTMEGVSRRRRWWWWVRGERRQRGQQRGGDKARQMGQTMRHRHPPCMSTTPPTPSTRSLIQSSAIPLSLVMWPHSDIPACVLLAFRSGRVKPQISSS